MSEGQAGAKGGAPDSSAAGHHSSRLRSSAVIRVAASVLIAAVATALAIVLFWQDLDVRTDIVGYAIVADYNPYNWYRGFYLVAGFFPVLALLVFVGLTRAGPKFGLRVPGTRGGIRDSVPQQEPGSPLEPDPPHASVSPATRRIISAARLVFVGGVLGLEAGIAADGLWVGTLLGTGSYVLCAIGACLLWRRIDSKPSLEARLATVNAVGASLAILGLAAVASASEVRILSDRAVDQYTWLPVWLALIGTAAVAAYTITRLRRTATPAAALRIERAALLLVAAPVGLFVLLAELPGEVVSAGSPFELL